MVKIEKEDYVVVIGGTNIDILGIPKEELIYQDSNIGNVKTSLGGVGRNIAENLCRLGSDTQLVSIMGCDPYGDLVVEEAKKIGLKLHNSLILKEIETSLYISILDGDGDMEIALSSMDSIENLNIDFIRTKKKLIEDAKVCIIDANIPVETIEFVLRNFNKTDFFLDTVSTAKAERMKDLIGYFHTIKPNKIEAEKLTGMDINTDEDLRKAIEYFHNEGVKEVVITLSGDGVVYSDGDEISRLKGESPRIVNATGAGDAFMAAISYGHMQGFSIEEKVRFGIGASFLAMDHENTINPGMSVENINKKLEETKIC